MGSTELRLCSVLITLFEITWANVAPSAGGSGTVFRRSDQFLLFLLCSACFCPHSYPGWARYFDHERADLMYAPKMLFSHTTSCFFSSVLCVAGRFGGRRQQSTSL